MNGRFQPLRYAGRQWRKSPGLAGVAVTTPALGMGANTASFGLLDQARLRALPVKEPNRLAGLRHSGSNTGHLSSRSEGELYFSYPIDRGLRDQNTEFSGEVHCVDGKVLAEEDGKKLMADGQA